MSDERPEPQAEGELSRRDLLVKEIDTLIRTYGEDKVLY